MESIHHTPTGARPSNIKRRPTIRKFVVKVCPTVAKQFHLKKVETQLSLDIAGLATLSRQQMPQSSRHKYILLG